MSKNSMNGGNVKELDEWNRSILDCVPQTSASQSVLTHEDVIASARM